MKAGEASVSVDIKIQISFFSSSDLPEFKKTQSSLKMQENNIFVSLELPEKASYSNMDIEPFYFLNRPSDTFKINATTGIVGLLKELDYEEQNQYIIQIVANNKNIPPIEPVSESAKNLLKLTVNVSYSH